MFSQFSVRRPYTVFVAVCLILVLGIISFVNMSTDLLPNIELPYIVVMTSYPGASPEQVELAVTRPLEAALGTAGGLKNVNSVSRENSSMIILEFVQTTNMDSAMIELSNNIDMLSARLDSAVSKPMLVRINPDMMPIMVATVDMEGKDMAALSTFVTETVMPRFERIEGVASVTPSGLLEKEMRVVLNQAKIDTLNHSVLGAVDQSLNDTKAKLLSAQKELDQALAKLNEETINQAGQMAEASVLLDGTIARLQAMLTEEAQLLTQQAVLQKERDMIAQLADLAPTLQELFPNGVTGLSPEEYAALLAQLGELLPADLAGLTLSEMTELYQGVMQAYIRLVAIDAELQNIQVRLMTVRAMKPQLEQGLAEATAAYQQLESGKMILTVELTKAQVQLANGQQELAKGLTELENARETARRQADLHGIITMEMVSGILRAQNFTMPAGYIQEGETGHLVKVVGRYDSEEAIRSSLLFSMDSVGDIRLEDVADISVTDNSARTYAKVNGNDGIVLSFQKQNTASTADVAGSIHQEILRLTDTHSGLNISPLMDQGEYINMSINSILQNLLYGGLLAILVLILFLKDLMPTLIIAISIPVSLLFAVTLMYFSGVSINIMSLSGLALGVGMLVDNSIVVIENIYRLRLAGVPVYRAAVQGARQVTGAIFASTLTTVCVFLPIVFTQGISRQLFTDMGLTIAFSLLASLVIAITVVPTLASSALRNTRSREIGWFTALVRNYEKVLTFSLQRKWIIMLLVAVLFSLSVYGTTVMGTSFLPEIDSPQMSATMDLPDGSTRDEIYAMADTVTERILQVAAVDRVGAMTDSGRMMGMGGGGGGGSADVSFFILLKDQRRMTNRDVEKEIMAQVADLDAEITVSASDMDMTALGGSGIQVVIKGQDLDQLAAVSEEVAVIMRSTEGIGTVTTGYEDASFETRIIIDRDAAMREGLTTAQVYQMIAAALSNETNATTLTQSNEEYPVVVVESERGALTRDTIGDYILTVSSQDGTEKEIPLNTIARIEEATSPDAIRRENQTRQNTVTGSIADGYNIGLVSRQFEGVLAEYIPPEGILIEIAGENESIRNATGDLILMIILAVIFIYLIMVAQFQSLLSPFIILFTLPLAFTGGLLLLWGAGLDLSVVALLGFLVLAGVVVNNGIVFVDYVNQLRLEGKDKREALLETGKARIRPILMTALTTILAMSTIALGVGGGAEMTQPMAVVAIGGLLYATLLTLLVVPVMYDFFHRGEMKKIDVYNG